MSVLAPSTSEPLTRGYDARSHSVTQTGKGRLLKKKLPNSCHLYFHLYPLLMDTTPVFLPRHVPLSTKEPQKEVGIRYPKIGEVNKSTILLTTFEYIACLFTS